MEAQTDSQNEALTPGQERFIADQLGYMRASGFPASTLIREEALLRTGFRTNNVIFGLFDLAGAGAGLK